MVNKEFISKECQEYVSQICEKLGEDMTSPNCLNLRKHIETCEDCKSYLESLKKTISVYETVKIELPENLQEKLMAGIRTGKVG